MYEEQILKKMIEIKNKQKEDDYKRLENEIYAEALLRVETEKLDDAVQSKDKAKLMELAGKCLWTDPCWLVDDIECYKCQSTGSSNPIIKQKARYDFEILSTKGNKQEINDIKHITKEQLCIRITEYKILVNKHLNLLYNTELSFDSHNTIRKQLDIYEHELIDCEWELMRRRK